MLTLALTSITVGIFDVKHYLHLQLVPHLSKDHQVKLVFCFRNVLSVLIPPVSTGEYLLTMLLVPTQVTCFSLNCSFTTCQPL